MRALGALALVLISASPAGCKHSVEWYCDEETPCLPRYPDRPYCDLYGAYPESEGVGRTCIPFPDDPSKDFCLTDEECPTETPVCGSDLVCRACVSNQDCAEIEGSTELTFCADTGSCLACEPGAFLRCDVDAADVPVLITCREDGTAEQSQACGIACDAGGQRCIDCQPNSANCIGSSASAMDYVTCDGTGAELSRVDCYAGCDDQPSNSIPDGCLDIDPRNCLGAYLDMASTASDHVLTGNTTFDTDTGEVQNSIAGTVSMASSIVDQPSCPADAVRVFVVGSLDIENARATGSRAMAIVSHGDLTIRGEFSVSAVGTQSGPAGRTSGVTCLGGAGQSGTETEGNAGSGGGSFGGAGGRGGNITTVAPKLGGSPGTAVSDLTNFELEPLVGGCTGGSTAGSGVGRGGGAGAVHLVSRTSIQLDGGIVSANGGGGGTQNAIATSLDTSPGGGSGGGILLEAPTVEGTSGAGVFANGGGGGCIDTLTSPIVHSGSDGQPSVSAAVGADCSLLGGGTATGGVGGIGSSAGGSGSDEAPASGSRGGGGGGGTGFIQVDSFAFDSTSQITRSPAVQTRALRTRPQQ